MQHKNNKKIVLYINDTFGSGISQNVLTITEHLLNTFPGLSILLMPVSPTINITHCLKIIKEDGHSENHLIKSINFSPSALEASCLVF